MMELQLKKQQLEASESRISALQVSIFKCKEQLSFSGAGGGKMEPELSRYHHTSPASPSYIYILQTLSSPNPTQPVPLPRFFSDDLANLKAQYAQIMASDEGGESTQTLRDEIMGLQTQLTRSSNEFMAVGAEIVVSKNTLLMMNEDKATLLLVLGQVQEACDDTKQKRGGATHKYTFVSHSISISHIHKHTRSLTHTKTHT